MYYDSNDKDFTPGHFTEEELNRIYNTYWNASFNERNLFFRALEKHIPKDARYAYWILFRKITKDYESSDPIDLSGCPKLASMFVDIMFKLENVKQLNFSECTLVNEEDGFKFPPKLEELDLSNRGVFRNEDFDILLYPTFSHLKMVNLRYNPDLTREMLDSIKTHLPQVEVLSDWDD